MTNAARKHDLPDDLPAPVIPEDMVDEAIAVEDAARDELGLTHEQRELWRAHYHAIGVLIQQAVQESPTADEARRRIAILRLELRTNEAAIDMIADRWTQPTR